MYQITKKLNEKELLHYGGTIASGGRPEIFFYRHHLANHLWNHEIGISRFFEAMGWPHGRRYRDVDPEIRPDAELLINDSLYFVEWDTGSESRTQWLKRISHYTGDFTLLVVTRDEKRLKDLVDWSGQLEDSVYLTTMEHALLTPYQTIWQALDGNIHPLEKPVGESGGKDVA